MLLSSIGVTLAALTSWRPRWLPFHPRPPCEVFGYTSEGDNALENDQVVARPRLSTPSIHLPLPSLHLLLLILYPHLLPSPTLSSSNVNSKITVENKLDRLPCLSPPSPSPPPTSFLLFHKQHQVQRLNELALRMICSELKCRDWYMPDYK